MKNETYVVPTRHGQLYVEVVRPIDEAGNTVRGPAIFTLSPYSILGRRRHRQLGRLLRLRRHAREGERLRPCRMDCPPAVVDGQGVSELFARCDRGFHPVRRLLQRHHRKRNGGDAAAAPDPTGRCRRRTRAALRSSATRSVSTGKRARRASPCRWATRRGRPRRCSTALLKRSDEDVRPDVDQTRRSVCARSYPERCREPAPIDQAPLPLPQEEGVGRA